MRTATIVLACLFISGFSGFSKTIHVPGDYTTIQEAIDASVDGDTVLVAPGTYKENIDFKGRAIRVQSRGGHAATFIKGAQYWTPVVTFGTGEGPDSVLDGFTITDGHAGQGGGIFCLYTSPTIVNNFITGNSAERDGGGIFSGGGYPWIENNVVTQNCSMGWPDSSGGGITCLGGAVVTNNTISDNWSDDRGGGIDCGGVTLSANAIFSNRTFLKGGGICCSGPATVNDNVVYSNQILSGDGSGGGICCFGALSITGNDIYSNKGGYYAGGIKCEEGSSPDIRRNSVHHNSADVGGGIACDNGSTPFVCNNLIHGNKADFDGGGIGCTAASQMTAVNNTITQNTAGWYGGGVACVGSAPLVVNTILWGNTAPKNPDLIGDAAVSYCCIEGGWPGEGNLDTDPLFEDPGNLDFHLSWLSPCINQGTNDGAPSMDLDGDERPYMGTVDMGADEFTGWHPLEADVFSISESAGGAVQFTLTGGPENGGRNYLLLGSVTGTVPGTPLPGAVKNLPLNWDFFTNVVIGHLNSPVFQNFLGTLTIGGGSAFATFDTLGPVPGTAGLTLSFAYALNAPWDFVSNPINVLVKR